MAHDGPTGQTDDGDDDTERPSWWKRPEWWRAAAAWATVAATIAAPFITAAITGGSG